MHCIPKWRHQAIFGGRVTREFGYTYNYKGFWNFKSPLCEEVRIDRVESCWNPLQTRSASSSSLLKKQCRTIKGYHVSSHIYIHTYAYLYIYRYTYIYIYIHKQIESEYTYRNAHIYVAATERLELEPPDNKRKTTC